MNNPVCAVCGHVNRVGAVACEGCDARLDVDGWAGDADQFSDAREPFDSTGEPSWNESEAYSTASETSGAGGAWSPAEEIPSPPFKGAGDVISPMLAIYRKHFTLVGILVLVTMVPEALLQYGIIDATGKGPVSVVGNDSRTMAFEVAGRVLLWLLTIASASLLSGSLVYAVVDLQRAGRAAAGESLSRGLKALPKVLLVTLLYSAVVVAGYVMLIVPGVIFSLMFAVCIPAAVVEGLGPIAALKRSHELTKGYKGMIFITNFLWGLLILALNWVVSWSFASSTKLDLLPTLLLQTAVLGMLNSSVHVLTVYIYLGLLREHRSGFQTGAFTHGPEAAG
ncbi:MAG: hypothetical protein QOH49_2418 [Acidobacteriota bacterium]|jgi:uncharacterized membrane protein|nr:hypothetical protein [Acidobacteriota bacterium]